MTSPDPATTVITAAPATIPWRRLLLVELMFLPIAGVFGYLVGWWLAGLLLLVSLLNIPLLARMRRAATANQPDRIEISRDRIATVSPRGYGDQLTRADGQRLEVRKLGPEPHVYIVGPGGDNGAISLGRFDVEEVGRAALAHGWPWQPPGTTAPIMPETMPEPAPEPAPARFHQPTEIQLRGGRSQTVPSKPALTATTLVAGLAVCGLVGLLATTDLPDAAFPIIAVGLGLLLVGLLVGGVFWLLRRSRAVVTIDPEQVAVKYGSLSATAVQRSGVATGDVGDRWVRLRDHNGKQLIWVPLRPKREEVLSALRWHGWPVT